MGTLEGSGGVGEVVCCDTTEALATSEVGCLYRSETLTAHREEMVLYP